MAAISSSQVSVGTSSPTALNSSVGYRQLLIIDNLDGTNPIFLGGSDVTSGKGVKVASGVLVNPGIVVPANQVLYAISSGGTVTTGVLVIPNP